MVQAAKARRPGTQPATSEPSSATERRLRIAIVAGLLAGLALTPRLWLSDRLYPLTPIARFLQPIPAPWDRILYAALLLTLLIIALVKRPAKWIAVSAVLALVEVAFDQSRLTPWFYQYLAMLLALAFYYRYGVTPDDDRHPVLNACRLVMVGVYFWSGLQKLHTDFMFRIFPWMIQPFTRALPHSLVAVLNSFGVVAPFLEIAIAIGLLSRRFRIYAIFGALAMHAFILLAIGPLGNQFNNVVWPWNVAMLAFLAILFWKRPSLSSREIVWPRTAIQWVLLALFGIAPALSFFNLWDSDLSAALYAGTRNSPSLYVTNALADRLPKDILQHVFLSGQPGINKIDLFGWSLADLNAPVYPEPRIYKSVGRYLCSYADAPSDVNLVIKRSRVLFVSDLQESYDCTALAK